MWDKMTICDSEANTVMEFDLVISSAEQSEQQGDREQQDDQEQQEDQEQLKLEVINKYIAKLPTVRSRQEVFEALKQWPDWCLVDLSKALGCLPRGVPAVFADYLGWTKEKAETEQNRGLRSIVL